jgi:hypothetical protein
VESEKWSHCYGWPTQMKNKKRSHYNRQPTQVENGLIVTGDLSKWKIWNCLIVMGDLPRWKVKSGLIIMGDLPKWKIKSGLIIMGDLLKWKNKKWSHYNGWPTQENRWKVKNVTYLAKSWRDDRIRLESLVLPDCRVDLKSPPDDKVDLLISLRFS